MLSLYRMVCNDSMGEGIVVDRMPEMLEHEGVKNSQPHTHTFYEILWFQEEGGVHTVDFQDYPVTKNSVFFLSPGQVHHFDGTTRHKGYSIKISSGFCVNSAGENDALHQNLFFGLSNRPVAQLDESATEMIESVIHRIEDEQKQENDYQHREMLCLMVRMLIILIHRHARHTTELSSEEQHSSAQKLYIRFRNMVETDFAHMHLVSDYAERLGISTKTLTNAVKTATGTTPLHVIDDRLILESKRLLRFSDLMVKEVAYQLGFDDPSNFVKFFRRHTGTLPGKYQE